MFCGFLCVCFARVCVESCECTWMRERERETHYNTERKRERERESDERRCVARVCTLARGSAAGERERERAMESDASKRGMHTLLGGDSCSPHTMFCTVAPESLWARNKRHCEHGTVFLTHAQSGEPYACSLHGPYAACCFLSCAAAHLLFCVFFVCVCVMGKKVLSERDLINVSLGMARGLAYLHLKKVCVLKNNTHKQEQH